ncbi:ATP-binding protein [Roseiarcaceae bacterium H3SJ34-1]|uniref:ATP-binding protein n=1 Tax=Terripilifer ovatus TaxID=3032367 RepID=UPI003AB97766|nr:ATP-binding protein [Roseiarcaceae bacterium H3SJ34-1]
MRHVFGSLTFRIALAFLLGLVLLQIVIAAAIIWPDGRPVMFRLMSPREAAAIASAVESVSDRQRDLVIAALNAGSLIVHVQPGSLEQAEHNAAPYLTELYSRYASELEGRAFRVEARGEQAGPAHGPARAATPAAVRLLIQLHTGDTLTIERAPVLLQRLTGRLAIIGAAVAGILLLILFYCIHQVVLPARRLAQAAHGLAQDIDMPDLPARGATEINMLSTAFNGMKHTIRSLMNERTRVLAAIAHDFRTYLTRLRLRAEFIDDPQQQAQAIRDLDDMNLLLDDTLIFARETTRVAGKHPEHCDVATEVESLAQIRQEIGEAVTVNIQHAGPLEARCAPLALRRMLANLTDNALRYGKNAELSAWREDAMIKLSVTDRGPGVPADALERILQPFERLEPSRGRQTGGAGLGLAIVGALAKSQGGDLKIENRREGGLRATISLVAG